MTNIVSLAAPWPDAFVVKPDGEIVILSGDYDLPSEYIALQVAANDAFTAVFGRDGQGNPVATFIVLGPFPEELLRGDVLICKTRLLP